MAKEIGLWGTIWRGALAGLFGGTYTPPEKTSRDWNQVDIEYIDPGMGNWKGAGGTIKDGGVINDRMASLRDQGPPGRRVRARDMEGRTLDILS